MCMQIMRQATWARQSLQLFHCHFWQRVAVETVMQTIQHAARAFWHRRYMPPDQSKKRASCRGAKKPPARGADACRRLPINLFQARISGAGQSISKTPTRSRKCANPTTAITTNSGKRGRPLAKPHRQFAHRPDLENIRKFCRDLIARLNPVYRSSVSCPAPIALSKT